MSISLLGYMYPEGKVHEQLSTQLSTVHGPELLNKCLLHEWIMTIL